MNLFLTLAIVLLLGVYVSFTKEFNGREVVVDLSRQLAANNNNKKDVTFETFVRIAIELKKEKDDDDNLMGNELARKFEDSYNSVAGKDKLERRVQSATYIEKKADREPKKWWYRIKVKGSCKGCGKNSHLFKKADAVKRGKLEINSFNNTDDDYTEDNTDDDYTDDNTNDDLYAILLDDFLKEYEKDVNADVSEIKIEREIKIDSKPVKKKIFIGIAKGKCSGCGKSKSWFPNDGFKLRSLVSNGVDGGNNGELSVKILDVIEEE